MRNGIHKNEHGIFYFVNDNLHREDGPAVIYPFGEEQWYRNGKLHREDGPAIDGISYSCYVLNGKLINVSSQKEFDQYLRLLAFI
jgi:hypothetical protein